MRCAALLLVSIFGWQAASWAQKGSPVIADRQRERRSFAQNLVKAINAAEADYRTMPNWITSESLAIQELPRGSSREKPNARPCGPFNRACDAASSIRAATSFRMRWASFCPETVCVEIAL